MALGRLSGEVGLVSLSGGLANVVEDELRDMMLEVDVVINEASDSGW